MTQVITISNGTTTVTMPRVKSVAVGGEEVAKAKTMASGKIVKDIIGNRATISASWDYVPAETITALLTMLKAGGFFTVDYPSPNGDASGSFSVTYPTLGIFAFMGGVPVWHDVTLTIKAQGVS